MTEIKVVFPHPDGPTNMSSSPRRTSRSTPRSAITLASPVPYVFVRPRQWTANCSFDAAVSIAYSIVCPSVLLEGRMYLSEARLQVAARNGRFGCLPVGLCGALPQSIVLSGFSKNNMQRREKIRA
jgi:hypothetical protein